MILFGKQVFGKHEKEQEPVKKTSKNYRRSQSLKVYIKGIDKSFDIVFIREFTYRFSNASNLANFNNELDGYLGERNTKGIRIGNTWYPSASIDRIVIGKMTYTEFDYNEES